jgi:hypothetical protein
MEMTKQTPYPIMTLVKPNIIPIPRIHILAHTIPYRLAKPPSSTHLTRIIRNIKAFTKKEHNKLAIEKAKQLLYANKWISND